MLWYTDRGQRTAGESVLWPQDDVGCQAWQQVPLPAEHLSSPLCSSKLTCAKFIFVHKGSPRPVLRLRSSRHLTNIRKTVGNLGMYCMLIILASNFLEYIQTSKWKIKEVRHSTLDGLPLGLLECFCF